MPPEIPDLDGYTGVLACMTRLIQAPEAPSAVVEDAAGFLAAAGAAPGDARQLAGFGPHRLLVYRRHVRRGIARAVRLEIPRTAARLGDAFLPWVDRWIEAEGPRSPYFRDVAFELVAWAAPRWTEDPASPGYLGDLARHELSQFEVGCAEDDDGARGDEITLEGRVRFSRSVRLRRYDHAVHRLGAALEARDVPDREPTALLLYRDADLEVRLLELTPLAAAVVERLLGGEPLGRAVVGACAAEGTAVDPAVTGSTAALLGDLLERGAILGGEA